MKASSRNGCFPRCTSECGQGAASSSPSFDPPIPVFVRFAGIDYDADDEAIAKLDDFVCRAQAIFDTYGGNLLQLTIGDKGAYLYAVFGSPLAHEDDAARAAAAALEVRELEGTTAATEIQIGIAHGRLRCGTYGHEMRRTFVCLGDAVNLSARLMSKAPTGQIYVVEDVRRRDRRRIHVGASSPPMRRQGEGRADRRVRPDGLTARRRQRQRSPRVADVRTRATSSQRCDATAGGRHSPDPGQWSGSRPRREWESRGWSQSSSAASPARHAGRVRRVPGVRANKSYFAWREIWRTLFTSTDDDPRSAARAPRGRAERSTRSSSLRMPLLEPVVDLPIPDNELTRAFDAKFRKTSLEGLLATCLRSRAARGPLVARAGGLPLARRALPRSARGARTNRGAACASSSSSRTVRCREVGETLGRRERCRTSARSTLTELGETRRRCSSQSKLEQISGDAGSAARGCSSGS